MDDQAQERRATAAADSSRIRRASYTFTREEPEPQAALQPLEEWISILIGGALVSVLAIVLATGEWLYDNWVYAEDDQGIASPKCKYNSQQVDNAYDQWVAFRSGNSKVQPTKVETPFGPVNLAVFPFPTDLAPKIYVGQDPNAELKYFDVLRKLESHKDPKNLASLLLDPGNQELKKTCALTAEQERFAAMLHAMVYLAERFRMEGSQKVYRAWLRAIVNGNATLTFASMANVCAFVTTAKMGKDQVMQYRSADPGIAGNAGPPWSPGGEESTDEERKAKSKAGVKPGEKGSDGKPGRPAAPWTYRPAPRNPVSSSSSSGARWPSRPYRDEPYPTTNPKHPAKDGPKKPPGPPPPPSSKDRLSRQ